MQSGKKKRTPVWTFPSMGAVVPENNCPENSLEDMPLEKLSSPGKEAR